MRNHRKSYRPVFWKDPVFWKLYGIAWVSGVALIASAFLLWGCSSPSAPPDASVEDVSAEVLITPGVASVGDSLVIRARVDGPCEAVPVDSAGFGWSASLSGGGRVEGMGSVPAPSPCEEAAPVWWVIPNESASLEVAWRARYALRGDTAEVRARRVVSIER